MDVSKKILNSTPENSSQDKLSLPDQSSMNLGDNSHNPDIKEKNFILKNPIKLKQGTTLRNRLLITVLPTVLIPLAIASFFGLNFTQREAKKTLLNDVEKSLLVSLVITENFFEEAFNATDLLAANSLVTEAFSSATQEVQQRGLLQKPIDAIEQEFKETKLLNPNTKLNNYLKALAKNKGLAEIILTDHHGFNIAYSSPTSDFVQSGEEWWESGKQKGREILEPTFDESTNSGVLELVNSIRNSNTGEVLGITKTSISVKYLNEYLSSTLQILITKSQAIQIIDTDTATAVNTITAKETKDLGDVIGGEPIIKAVSIFNNALISSTNPDKLVSVLAEDQELSNITVTNSEIKTNQLILSFEYGGQFFKVINIPESEDLFIIGSVDKQEIASAGNDLILTFGVIAIILGTLATILILLLSKQISNPLTNLTTKAQQVAQGNLDVQADLEGTSETITLADSFNKLVKQVNNLIREQQIIAQEKQQEKATLEQEIYQLVEEVEGALEGDLTVRASLDSMEMSTVADLFNAIIDSLKDIAIQVKQSSTQVSSSLVQNEQSIQNLAQQAMEELEATYKTLKSVDQMSQSIDIVSQNAGEAKILSNDAYNETKESTKVMDKTVNSILNLRNTVGETAKKMKRLGESSQKISQVVSLIEEIALKTNLLAINASIEASRAGEQGQGFTVVAEQVGALAEQSATATKEIAQIVSNIQLETQEVAQAMELGTSQVVDSTRLVEATRKRLESVLERSQSINELMQSISQATILQTDTSHLVSQLMEKIAKYSEQRVESSMEVSQSMQNTARIAQELESAVEQFKVDEG